MNDTDKDRVTIGSNRWDHSRELFDDRLRQFDLPRPKDLGFDRLSQ
jgi:hypothetical protein